nr:ABC transporter substrate-binding protein [Afipia sp.]
LVVNGAGQQGLWEDMAGRTGEIAKVKALRAKIVAFAPNSAAARQTWTERPDIDAWIIWTIWQVSNPSLADLVEVEPEYRIYRDTGVGLTRRGQGNPAAKEFVAYLRSPEGAAIFRKWGWIARSP